jgi:hypothetical protein
LKWHYNDGGRHNYYKAKNVGDCVTRAIAIANNMDYKIVYKDLYELCKTGANQKNTPRNGICKSIYSIYLEELGWQCIDCKNTGINLNKFVDKKIICKINHHLCAIIYGTIEDIFNPIYKNGNEVIEYWIKK